MNTVLTNANVTIDGKAMKKIKKMVTSIKSQPLDYLKFRVLGSKLTIELQNTIDISFIIEKTIDTKAEAEDTFLVPIELIKKITRIRNDDQFNFQKVDSETIRFIKNGSNQTVKVLSESKFQEFASSDNLKYICDINYDEILNLNKAIITVLKSDVRPILKAVLIRGGKIVSTDSHRLFMTESQINYENDINIHHFAIKKLKDLFNKDDYISVYAGDNLIKFESEDKKMIINQMEGLYPTIDRLIPEDYRNEYIIYDVDSLKNVLNDSLSVAKNIHNFAIELKFKDNQLQINANDKEGRKFEAAIQAYSVDYNTDKSFTIYVNANYLLDMIKQLQSDSLHFKFIGSMKPFSVVNKENDSTLCLILPIRVH